MDFKKYFKENKLSILSIFVFTIIYSLFLSLIPMITKNVIDKYQLFAKQDIVKYSAYYVFAILLYLLFEYFNKLAICRFERNFLISIRRDIYANITVAKHGFLNTKSSGDIVNIILDDTKEIFDDYLYCWIELIMSIVSFIVYSCFMFYLNPYLALAVIFASLLSMLIPKLVGRKLTLYRKKRSDEKAKLIDSISNLADSSELYDNINDTSFQNFFNKKSSSYEHTRYRLLAYQSFTEIFSGLSLYFINIVAFILGLFLCYLNVISISSLIAIIAYIDLVAIPVRDIIYLIITLKSSSGIKNKISEYFDEDNFDNYEKIYDFNNLSVNNLNYSQGEFKLENINIQFSKNNKYALVGDNGSGKSTLLKLLAKELYVPENSIFIDDKDINYVSLSSLVYYSSESKIIEGNLEDNLTLYNCYHNKLNIEEFGLEEIANKDLDVYGKNISFGQKSRINIMRALNSEKKLLLLDEPFANVDKDSENILTDILLDSDATIILVTHNRDHKYLNQFDKVFYIENGKIDNL